MCNPRVSIVMPTYNHARYIQQAIEGVLSQRADFDYQLIIGDDCSVDGTGELCQRYADAHPQRIVLHRRPQNIGAQRNWAQLYESARGEFLALCDGDDYWTHPHKLAHQVALLEANPHWSGCFHRAKIFDEGSGKYSGELPDRGQALPLELTFQDFSAENLAPTASMMYRRGLVPQSPDWMAQLALGDWPMHLLHALQGPLGFWSETCAVYRVHGKSAWSPLPDNVRLNYFMRASFVMDEHLDESVRGFLNDGRIRLLGKYTDEIERLRKIEARYRTLQLHRLAGFGRWVRNWFKR